MSSPPSGSGVSPFGDAVGGRRRCDAPARRPPLSNDLLARRDLDHAAIADVRHDDVAVRQRIGIVGRIEVAGPAARGPVMPVLPDDSTGRDVDPVDDMMPFVVGDDRLAVRSQERVVGRESLAVRQAARRREAPQGNAGRRDDQEPAVAAIGDEQAAGEGTAAPRGCRGGRRRSEANRHDCLEPATGPRSRGAGRGLRASPSWAKVPAGLPRVRIRRRSSRRQQLWWRAGSGGTGWRSAGACAHPSHPAHGVAGP